MTQSSLFLSIAPLSICLAHFDATTTGVVQDDMSLESKIPTNDQSITDRGSNLGTFCSCINPFSDNNPCFSAWGNVKQILITNLVTEGCSDDAYLIIQRPVPGGEACNFNQKLSELPNAPFSSGQHFLLCIPCGEGGFSFQNCSPGCSISFTFYEIKCDRGGILTAQIQRTPYTVSLNNPPDGSCVRSDDFYLQCD
jgi:hypothetical protein